MAVLLCTSCKVNVVNLPGSVKFSCPKCGKSTIIRCPGCRKTGAKYRCDKCSFEGPN